MSNKNIKEKKLDTDKNYPLRKQVIISSCLHFWVFHGNFGNFHRTTKFRNFLCLKRLKWLILPKNTFKPYHCGLVSCLK